MWHAVVKLNGFPPKNTLVNLDLTLTIDSVTTPVLNGASFLPSGLITSTGTSRIF